MDFMTFLMVLVIAAGHRFDLTDVNNGGNENIS